MTISHSDLTPEQFLSELLESMHAIASEQACTVDALERLADSLRLLAVSVETLVENVSVETLVEKDDER